MCPIRHPPPISNRHLYKDTYVNGESNLQQGDNYHGSVTNNFTQVDGSSLDHFDIARIPLTNPVNDFSSILGSGSRELETCHWFFQSTEFTAWKKIIDSQLLAITGKPGTGKTTLAAFFVEKVKVEFRDYDSGPKGTVLYFFCDHGTKERRSALSVLRGLLYELCRSSESARELMKQRYDQHTYPKDAIYEHFDRLWRIFEAILDDPRTGPVTIVVDGLDECDEESRSILLRRVNHTLRRSGQGHPTKFIITSRDENCFEKVMERAFEHLRLGNQNTRKDLHVFIDKEVSKLSKDKVYTRSLEENLRTRLHERNGDSFLWVKLVITQLRKQHNDEAHTWLQSCPLDLDGLYDNIIKRIPNKRRKDAKLILEILAAARRPLTRSEMLRVFYIRSCFNGQGHKGHEVSQLEIRVFDACSDLITIEGTKPIDKLRFVHRTAKEYILKDPTEIPGKTLVDLGTLGLFMLLFTSVLIYICLSMITNTISPAICCLLSGAASFTICIISFCSSASRIALLRYFRLSRLSSASYFVLPYWNRFHYRIDLTQANFIMFKACLAEIMSWLSQEAVNLPSRIPESAVFTDYAMRNLHIHAARACDHVIEAYQVNNKEMGHDPSFQRARDLWLKLACQHHHTFTSRLIRMLLDSGAIIESDARVSGVISELTPLSLAAYYGNEAAMGVLLDKRAKIESYDAKGWTPLRWAFFAGHFKTAKILIDHKANVDALDGKGETILMTMMSHVTNYRDTKYNDLFELLTRSKTSIDAVDAEGMTALCRAASCHQWAFVKLLIDCGADIDKPDKRGMTALLHALRTPRLIPAGKHTFVVTGSNCITLPMPPEDKTVEIPDPEYEHTIGLLITKSKSTDGIDIDGRTALSLAAENGDYCIVRLLLENGADPNIRDNDGLTPLMWASKIPNFCSLVCSDLLFSNKKGILLARSPLTEIDIKDGLSSNQQIINRRERSDIVFQLLNHKATFNDADSQDMTALDLAIQYGLDDVAGILTLFSLQKCSGLSVTTAIILTSLQCNACSENLLSVLPTMFPESETGSSSRVQSSPLPRPPIIIIHHKESLTINAIAQTLLDSGFIKFSIYTDSAVECTALADLESPIRITIDQNPETRIPFKRWTGVTGQREESFTMIYNGAVESPFEFCKDCREKPENSKAAISRRATEPRLNPEGRPEADTFMICILCIACTIRRQNPWSTPMTLRNEWATRLRHVEVPKP